MSKPGLKSSTRQVTARFLENPELADLERDSGIRNLRLTMIGLWQVSDEQGIFEWEPRRLAAHIYRYNDVDQRAVEPAMEAFVNHPDKFLLKIEVNGAAYGVWPNWSFHNDFRNNESRYPQVFAKLVEMGVRALANPREGRATLKSPEKPLENEVGSTKEKGKQEKENERTGIPSSSASQISGPQKTSEPPVFGEAVDRLATHFTSKTEHELNQSEKGLLRECLRKLKHDEANLQAVIDFALEKSWFADKIQTFGFLYDHLDKIVPAYNAYKRGLKKQSTAGTEGKPEYQKDAGKFFARAKEKQNAEA